ncbi:hypothetical protein AAVH_00604 [Aphelenchoides avenae]|nr:hypothetical protein AAVH_00604 [Aphelenchus avenae]
MSGAQEQERGVRGGRGGNRGAGVRRGGGFGGYQDDGAAAASGGGGRGGGGRYGEAGQDRKWQNKPLPAFDPDRYENKSDNISEGTGRGNTGAAATGGRGRGASRGGGDYQGPRRTGDSGTGQSAFDGQNKPSGTTEGVNRGYSGGAARGGRGRGAPRGGGDSQDSRPTADVGTGQAAFEGQDDPENTIKGVVHGDSTAPRSTRGRGAAARGRGDDQDDRHGGNDGAEQWPAGEATDAFWGPPDNAAAAAAGDRGRGRGGRGGAGQGRKWDGETKQGRYGDKQDNTDEGVGREEPGAAPRGTRGRGAARGRSDYHGDRRAGDDATEQSMRTTDKDQQHTAAEFGSDDKPAPGFSSQRRGRAVGNAARGPSDLAATYASDFNEDFDALAVKDSEDAPALDYPVTIPAGRVRGGGPKRGERPPVGGSLQPAPSLDDNEDIVAPMLEDNVTAAPGARRNRSEFPESDEPSVPANATAAAPAARQPYQRRPGLGAYVLQATAGHVSTGGQRVGGESSRPGGRGGGNFAGTASGNRSRDVTDAAGSAGNKARQDNKGSYGGRRPFDNRTVEPSDNATTQVNLGGNTDRQETARGRPLTTLTTVRVVALPATEALYAGSRRLVGHHHIMFFFLVHTLHF